MAVEINGKSYTIRNLKTKDIPAVSRILKKMELTKVDLQGLFGNENAQEVLGVRLMMFVFSHIGDAEQELYQFFGGLIGMDPKEVADLDIEDFAKVIEQFKSQDGFKHFLSLASKLMQ